MIYLRDGDWITKSKIVSKNDEKLIKFANNNSKIDFKNFDFISSKDRRAGGNVGYCNGWYLQRANDMYFPSDVINTFKLKKRLTLSMVTEALKNSDIEIPRSFVQSSFVIELENFFLNPFDDLEKIESIIDNSYFYDFLEKMYSDYSGFIEIFPYIDLEIVDQYFLEKYLSGTRLFESKNFGGKSAINNRKILTKTKEFITRLDK